MAGRLLPVAAYFWFGQIIIVDRQQKKSFFDFIFILLDEPNQFVPHIFL